jgi:hypothetical protein
MDERLKEKFAHLHGTVVPYAVVSFEPPIFHVQLHGHSIDHLVSRYAMLFAALEGRQAWCLLCYSFDLNPWLLQEVRQMESALQARFPNLELIHLGNTRAHCELLSSAGSRAIHCNHNCFVDEAIYRPDPARVKRFDAVYDARLSEFKRHHLAKETRSLALLYYLNPDEDLAYVARVKRELAHAHFFNHDAAGSYRTLNSAEVTQALNACRVGLCLSAQEGAMYASAQYLLSGLPVVTTPSQGGRDEFFDPAYVRTAAPEPAAIASAVEELVASDLRPEPIREATLARIQSHRDRFIALVQGLYDRSGVRRKFRAEWDQVFFNRLLSMRSHLDTIARMRRAWGEQ